MLLDKSIQKRPDGGDLSLSFCFQEDAGRSGNLQPELLSYPPASCLIDQQLRAGHCECKGNGLGLSTVEHLHQFSDARLVRCRAYCQPGGLPPKLRYDGGWGKNVE